MQPSGEGRFTPKRGDLAKQLQERFLSQVFRFGRIAHHTQTQSVYAAVVQAIDALKRRRIALLGQADSICLRQLTGFTLSRAGHSTRRDDTRDWDAPPAP
jgi:hypothetical protein